MRQPDSRHKQAYLPSLLDRLIDDAPQKLSERPDAYAPDHEGMRRIVQRDLSLLLNTINLEDEIDMSSHSAAAASVVNYGIPALTGSYLTDRNWESIEKLIRLAITRFEPRLIPESLWIRPINSNEPMRYNKLTFEIHGLMQWSPYPLEFRIQSMLDVEMNKVTLAPGAHQQN
ncbi:MAG TPA: type VI secretion system baseplate subunit TssE [Trinickia sp.]|nr:type VI secretion system baseplate subunit TssE [Trinickia sp.]